MTGPAAVLSADPTFAPLDQSVPALPAATAVAPANTAAAAVPPGPATPLSIDDLLGQQPSGHKPPKHGSAIGRFFKRLVILAMLVGAGYAAYTYGPGLYEEYTSSETDPTAVDAPDEVDAPLAFPSATPAPTPVRTAEFILEGLPGAPAMSYQVTTDFETNVSQVDVSRANGPDLQILTYGEAALIRKVDDDQWHQLERGEVSLESARDLILGIGEQSGLVVDIYVLFLKMAATNAGAADRAPLVERVRELKAEGYVTGIITNNVAEFGDGWRGLIPIDELFDFVVDSSSVGVRKPDPRIFQLALQQLKGLAPQQAVFLDDYQANVDAARALGLKGITVGPDLDAVLRELEELLAL